MARTPKTRTARPLFPNAGVDAWYRTELQKMVRAMSQDMLDRIRAAWHEAGPGLAQDTAPALTAAGVIFRAAGRILLLQRADGTGWGWPGGGVEVGETPEQAARREVLEEISEKYDGPLQFYCVQDWRNVRFVTYVADLPDPFSIDVVLNHEHTATRWVTMEEALAMNLHPGPRATLGIGMAQDAKRLTPAILLDRALSKWGGLWIHRFNVASDKLARQFATKSKRATEAGMMAQLKEAGFTVKFKPTKAIRNAFDAVAAENVGLIRSIPQKYLADVQQTVWQGVASGSDLATVADTIQQKYGIAHRRAALIARDQNHKAKAAIEKANRLEVGITAADWQHSHAGKDPRPTHVAMNGQRYDIAKGMWDSAVQKYIWPGTEINCRCSDRPVIPGFD